jgi:hypothetical protein
MSLLGIIETLRRNLKTVVSVGSIVLALVVVADGVRLMTASGEHEAAPASEHTPATAAVHESHAAVAAEHAVPAHGESAGASHDFWATTYHIAENVPVFWTLFGFLGCVVLVVVSKTYGHFGVSKREDYYSE